MFITANYTNDGLPIKFSTPQKVSSKSESTPTLNFLPFQSSLPSFSNLISQPDTKLSKPYTHLDLGPFIAKNSKKVVTIQAPEPKSE